MDINLYTTDEELEIKLLVVAEWPTNFDFHFPGIFQIFPGDFSSFSRYFHGAAGSTRTHLLVKKDLKYKNQSSVILN